MSSFIFKNGCLTAERICNCVHLLNVHVCQCILIHLSSLGKSSFGNMLDLIISGIQNQKVNYTYFVMLHSSRIEKNRIEYFYLTNHGSSHWNRINIPKNIMMIYQSRKNYNQIRWRINVMIFKRAYIQRTRFGDILARSLITSGY